MSRDLRKSGLRNPGVGAAIGASHHPQPPATCRQPAGGGMATGIHQSDRLLAQLSHRRMGPEAPGRPGDLLVPLTAGPRPEHVADGSSHDQSCSKTHGRIMPDDLALDHRQFLWRCRKSPAAVRPDHNRI